MLWPLRYGWIPSRIPLFCEADPPLWWSMLSHARGEDSLRDNQIWDVTANLLTEVCNDIRTEPDLQPLTGETMTRSTANTADGARLDIAVNGFWGGRYERTFLDVRVFNSHAPTNRNTSISNCYTKHEAEKRAYEHATNSGGGTLVLHPFSFLCNRGNGQAMYDLL